MKMTLVELFVDSGQYWLDAAAVGGELDPDTVNAAEALASCVMGKE